MSLNRIFGSLILVVSACGAALADEASVLRTYMQKSTTKFTNAVKKGDTAAMRTMILTQFTNDFVFSRLDGMKYNRDEWLTTEVEYLANMKNIKHFDIALGKVTIVGNRAWCDATMLFEADARMTAREPWQHWMMKGSSRMNFVHVNKAVGWKISSIKEVGALTWINGKKVKM